MDFNEINSAASAKASFHNHLHNLVLVGHSVLKLVNSEKESHVDGEKQQESHLRCYTIHHVFKVL